MLKKIKIKKNENNITIENNKNNEKFRKIRKRKSNLNNDISYLLDSRVLENVDKLSPEKRRCIICLENFIKSDKIVNLSCLHMFHDECIRKCLNENNFFPICKNEI